VARRSEVSEPHLFNYQSNLFERVCSLDELKLAFKAVKRNGGAPGIDGVTTKEFEEGLDQRLLQLKKELESWTYQPKPVKQVDIPKPDGSGTRRLGIPCVRDRVVQACIKDILEPILDPLFSEHSYGFRPKRNQWQAIRAAQGYAQSGKEFVVDIDLEKFFDRVQHDRLIHRLNLMTTDKRVLRLIGITLRSGIMKDGIVSVTEEGTVQGSPLSPILSNVVLDELDKELEKRGLQFCRFADDCNIFTGSEKAAKRVMESVGRFIEERLKLVVNRAKSKVAKSEFVKFLGITIVSGTIAISVKSMAKAMDKIRDLTPRGTATSMELTIEKINSWYLGWANYYKITQYPSQLRTIEAHVRRRLRSRIIAQQKRKRNLFARLLERGVRRGKAAKTVFSNKGRWALSHTQAVEQAYPNRWFAEELNLATALDEKQPHWFALNRWIKLS
jgi:group II intron reverse transcriptase/maturase